MSKKKTTTPVPFGLTGKAAEAYEKWKAVLESRGQWSDDHIEIVAMSANQFGVFWECTQVLEDEGLSVTHSNGTRGQNPLFPIQQAALKNVMTFTNKYGLNLLFQDKVAQAGEDEESEI